MENSKSEDLIVIGKIVKAHGIKGEVAIFPLTNDLNRFYELQDLFIESDSITKMKIIQVREHKGHVLIFFEGITNRTDAEKLKNCFVSLPKEQMVQLDDDTFFHFDLIGLKVVSDDGETLGEIVEVMSFPANDVWRVEGERNFLLPATKNIVLGVDLKERVVTIKLIEGLIL